MARTAGRRRLAGRAAAQAFGYGRRARLDSRCAGGLGSAMAAPMIPPAHAPAFLAAHGWGDAQILPLAGDEIGRAHVCTPVTNAHLVCRLLLDKKKKKHHTPH